MPSAEKGVRHGGGWNYRICRETLDNGDFLFTLREVFYDVEGNPSGWTAEPVGFTGDTWKDVADDISLASGCIGTSILDLDTRQWIKPGPRSSKRPTPKANTCGPS